MALDRKLGWAGKRMQQTWGRLGKGMDWERGRNRNRSAMEMGTESMGMNPIDSVRWCGWNSCCLWCRYWRHVLGVFLFFPAPLHLAGGVLFVRRVRPDGDSAKQQGGLAASHICQVVRPPIPLDANARGGREAILLRPPAGP